MNPKNLPRAIELNKQIEDLKSSQSELKFFMSYDNPNKQIIEKCIQAYQLAIVEAKDMSYQELQSYLNEKDMGFGVCVYIFETLSKNYEDHIKWAKQYTPVGQAYWCKTPNFCSSKSAILESLNHRLKLLKRQNNKN